MPAASADAVDRDVLVPVFGKQLDPELEQLSATLVEVQPDPPFGDRRLRGTSAGGSGAGRTGWHFDRR